MDVICFIIRKDIKSALSIQNAISVLFFLICIVVMPPYDEITLKIKGTIGGIVPLIIAIVSAYMLNREFEYNTHRYLYSGKVSRWSILVSKVISVMIISWMISDLCGVLWGVGWFIDGCVGSLELLLLNILNMQILVVSFGLLVCSVGFFISILTESFISSVMILFVLFVDLFNRLILMAAQDIKVDWIRNIIVESPMLKATEGFSSLSYSGTMLVSILIYAIVILVIDCKLIEIKAFK